MNIIVQLRNHGNKFASHVCGENVKTENCDISGASPNH